MSPALGPTARSWDPQRRSLRRTIKGDVGLAFPRNPTKTSLPNQLPNSTLRLPLRRHDDGRSPPPRAAALRVPVLRVGAAPHRAGHTPPVGARGGGGGRGGGRRRRDPVGRAHRRLQRLLQLPPPGTRRAPPPIGRCAPRAPIVGSAA